MEQRNLIVGTQDCPVHSVASIIGKDERIIDKWTILSRGLDISSAEIKKFSHDLLLDKITHSDLIYEIVERWVTRKARNAKLAILILLVVEECGAEDVGDSLRRYFNLSPLAIYDLINWDDLTPALQARVSNTLDKLFPGIKIANIRPILKGALLAHLTKGIPQTLPQPLSYYISRTVLTRNIISTNIFEQNCTHIFLISGMERHELSRFAKDKSTDNSSNQIRAGSITVRHMIIDVPGHFDRICKLTSKPVHWFRWEDGKLKWIQSRGGISAVQEFADEGSQDALNEEDFCKNLRSNLNRHVCISDSPGMGKSVFLAEVGRRLTELYPEGTVIFLVFNEVMNQIKQIDFKSVLKSFQISDDHHAITIELLLDGFDEMDSVNLQLAKELLYSIKAYCKTVRIWVTTRPHLLTQLEEILETIGFNILPFSIDDQLQFLTKYWQGTNELSQERLVDFAYYCLRNLKLTVVQTVPMGDIAGIPLQCLLLAEVYEEEAVDYAVSDDLACNFPTMLINSVTDLYKSLIEKKFQKRSGSIQPQTLMDMHAYLSLKSFFPERLPQFQHFFEFDDVDRPEMVKVGLMEGSNKSTGLLRFVHRTFAEYFLAWFVMNQLQCDGPVDEVLSEFFLHDILHTTPWVGRYDRFIHPVIIYFVDTMMKNRPGIILTDDQVSTLLDSEIMLQQLGNACASSNCLQILKFLITNNAFGSYESRCFDESFLLFCIRSSCLDLVKVVLDQVEIHHEFNVELQGKALSESVRRGEFSIVEFLLKERQLLEMVENSNAENSLLLHVCLECHWLVSEAELNGKLQVMQMLVDLNPFLLEAKDKFGSTPLLHAKSHIVLKLRLIDMGANILARDNWDQTVLHVMDNFSKEDFHELLCAIPEDALRELVQVEDCWFRETARFRSCHTTLSRLVERFDPLPETLDKFEEAGADFNYVGKYGYPILASAISYSRNGETIRKLIECGANVRWTKGWKRKTLLHIAAVWKNPEAVAVLLNYFDKDVRDLTWKTPMHYARRGGEEKVHCFELGLALANKMGESFTQ